MYTPVYRGELTERTDIRLAHDDQYLYVFGALYDTDPDRIRINSLYRDQISGDDLLGIVVDPFDDNDIGLWFWTNPAGIRGDAEITADGQGNTNVDWNTHWDVATLRTEEGWFAEMRIPFSSLGFQAVDGRVHLGLTVYRYIARKNERHVFPDISPEFDYRRPSLAHDAVLSGVTSSRPIYVTPYVLSGLGREPILSSATGSYEMREDVSGELGLDVKYNLQNNLTLDVSVNTDFAQVEADDQQVNLTRFELFFPEKRQFFQERSGIFNFFTGGSTRLFHSRRIGLVDGQAVRILGGARLVGRVGDWDVGMLNMQTASSEFAPAENFGVMRFRRRMFNDLSNVGAMMTTRIGNDGSYTVAYGIDGSVRVFGDDQVTVQWAQSFDQDVIDSGGVSFPDAGLLRVSWNNTSARGFTYAFGGRWSGPNYQPGAGFVTRRDFSDLSFYVAYFHYTDGGGSLRRIDPFQLFGSVTWRNVDGTVESAFIEHDFDLQWQSGNSLGLDLELYHEDLREPLMFPKSATVPAGSFTFPRFEGDYSTPPGNLFRAGFGWGVGRFYDGWRANARVSPQWNVSPHLSLTAQYQLDLVRFPDRAQGFDAHIVRLRARAAANSRFSLHAFGQLSNANELGAANVRLRYNLREGNDLWIVYNHGWNLDLDRENPRLPRTDNQTLVVKYTHTFRGN